MLSSKSAQGWERRLVAVLAADVAGYSCLMGADEEGTLARLKATRKALVDPAIASHRGRIVKTTVDGLLVESASAVDAARCGVEVLEALRDAVRIRPRPAPSQRDFISASPTPLIERGPLLFRKGVSTVLVAVVVVLLAMLHGGR